MKFDSNQDRICFQICGEIVTEGGSTLPLAAQKVLHILGLIPLELVIFDRPGVAGVVLK